MRRRFWLSRLLRLHSRIRNRRWPGQGRGLMPRRLLSEPLEARQMLTTFLVDDLGDNTTGGDGAITLREAILAANTNSAVGDAPAGTPGLDTINFQTGLTGTINMSLGQFTITEDLTINGPGASVITIDAGGSSRIFDISDSSGGVIDVEIHGLTLTGGNAGSGDGGAIRSLENLTVRYSVLTGNTAEAGGAVMVNSTTALIQHSTISGNTAEEGGGLFLYGSPSVNIENTTVSGNAATGTAGSPGLGGGIVVDVGTAIIANSTITGNSANGGAGSDGQGGGVFNAGGTVGGGNTIIATNTASTQHPDVSGAISSSGYNLIGDASGGSGFVATDQVGTSGSPIDPVLGPLQNNGGPTETHELLLGSPAINAGDPAFVGPPNFDQRGPGFDRVRDGTLDVGAYEIQNLPPSPPVDIDPAMNMVDEGAATGTPVGITAQSIDPDGDPVTYSLTDDAGGRFQVDPTTGVVTVADGSLLDGLNVQTIAVQADDGSGGTSTSNFDILPRNVAPVITSLATDATLADKALPGETVTLVGSFFDPGVPDTHTATVDWGDGSPAEALTVDQVANTFTGDHEYTTGGIFTITVTVTDDDGGFDFETTTAVVTGVRLTDHGELQVIGTDGRDIVIIKEVCSREFTASCRFASRVTVSLGPSPRSRSETGGEWERKIPPRQSIIRRVTPVREGRSGLPSWRSRPTPYLFRDSDLTTRLEARHRWLRRWVGLTQTRDAGPRIHL